MAKIAISLPDEVLQNVERECSATGESRSEFFRRAVKAYFQNKQKREDIERYIQGYLQIPESDDELGWVETSSRAVLEQYPWEDEAE